MSMHRYWKEILAATLLAILTFFVYWGVLTADFVQWDDDTEVYCNPHLKGLSAETLRWAFTDVSYVWRYQPLTWLTWSGVYELSGLRPVGYHLANLLFHTVNAVLVFLILRKLLSIIVARDDLPARHNRLLLCAAAGTLLWAVHPLRVEMAAWVTALSHCQAAFFVLLAALCYLHANAPAVSGHGMNWWRWGAVLSFALSLFSFPMGLGFVGVIVVLDFFPLRRFNRGPRWWWDTTARRVWLEKLPFVGTALLVVVVGLTARFNTSSDWPKPVSLAEFGIVERVMQAFYIWAHYLWKPWLPCDLSPVYTTLVDFQPTELRFLLNTALVIGLTILLVWKRHRWPQTLALWLTHLVLLIPVLGFTEHPHYPSDRYSYLPGILWSIVMACGLWKLWQHPKVRMIALAVCLMVVAALGGMSFRQTEIWRNSEVLFRYVISELGDDPYRGGLHCRLGMCLAAQGRINEAMEQFNAALSINPNNAESHYFLAGALARQKQMDEAVAHFQAALKNKPDYAAAANDLAWILATESNAALRNVAEAVRWAERACELTTNQVASYLDTLGVAYSEAGRFKKAVEITERAVARALAAGDKQMAAQIQSRLEHYRAGRAYREIPERSGL